MLLFVDNIFRFSQARLRSIGAAGPPALGCRVSAHARRDGQDAGAHCIHENGSITSVQAVYVPADDLTDPAPATTFTHLDATTVLSRSIAELGIYPAVDPWSPSSISLRPKTSGKNTMKPRSRC